MTLFTALCCFCLPITSTAQTLNVNATITGISHQFFYFLGSGSVTDSLDISPASTVTNLSQYSTYVFNYTAPAGKKIEVQNPGTSYEDVFKSLLINTNNSFSTQPGGSVSVSFDNLQGTVTPSFTDPEYSSTYGIDDTVVGSSTGTLSFTGFTLTVSGVPSVPAGTQTYYLSPIQQLSDFSYNTPSATDPGSFVSLENTSATPEPGGLPLLLSGIGSTCLFARKRLRHTR